MRLRSVKHRLGGPKKSFKPSRRLITFSLTIGLLTSVGVAVANQLAIDPIEFGSGLVETPPCLVASRVDFSHSVETGGDTTINEIAVSGVSADCSGDYISLKLINSAGETIDEIIWHATLAAGDTTMTLRADGSSTSSSNFSEDGASVVWPDSQVSPEGLQSPAASQVEETQFSMLISSRSATD